MALEIPVLETERLILRGHRRADFPAILEMWRDPVVYRYIGGKARSQEEAWLKFLRAAGFWTHLGYGFWVVEEKATGAVAGEVGFGDFKRDIDPPLHGKPEMGWALAPGFHGRGIASEATRAVVDWGDSNLDAAITCCIIMGENAPSLRVAAKLGYVPAGHASHHGEDIEVFERRAPGR